MAALGAANVVARRVVDDLIDFNGETSVPQYMKFFILQPITEERRFVNRMLDEAQGVRNCIAQLNVVIAEIEAMEDLDEVYDSLMSLRDTKRAENNKLMLLNDVIAKAEEEIKTQEAMDVANNGV
nr:hypothetical protein [Tanacetum cinerariifolium]